MKRRFEMWIGGRYVRARSRNSFVSLISAISMLGIAIAVLVLIVVMSVVNGFERELKDRLLAMTAHATIEDTVSNLTDFDDVISTALRNPRVTAAAPYIDGQALLVAGLQLSGAELRGVDPELEDAVSGISSAMQVGDLASLAAGEFNIVLGVELADELRVVPGDKVTVTLAEGRVTPAGVIPRTKRFTVSGIYRVGMYEFDRRLAFISLGRSIQITKSILFAILMAIVAVAAFNIVSTLVMVVKDKQSDIAILRTIGAKPSSILRVFVTQGSIVGIVGTLLGVVGGVLIALNLESIVGFFEAAFGIKFLAADVYFISDLPSELKIGDVVRIASIALVLALVSTLYPAWVAAKTAPAEALRYD
jgi:lipoprotein-releasing system permease protein